MTEPTAPAAETKPAVLKKDGKYKVTNETKKTLQLASGPLEPGKEGVATAAEVSCMTPKIKLVAAADKK